MYLMNTWSTLKKLIQNGLYVDNFPRICSASLEILENEANPTCLIPYGICSDLDDLWRDQKIDNSKAQQVDVALIPAITTLLDNPTSFLLMQQLTETYSQVRGYAVQAIES